MSAVGQTKAGLRGSDLVIDNGKQREVARTTTMSGTMSCDSSRLAKNISSDGSESTPVMRASLINSGHLGQIVSISRLSEVSELASTFPVYDYLNLAENPKIRKLLSKHGEGPAEKVHFSDYVIKINRRDKEQRRVLLITNRSIYNVDPKKFTCKRQIHIQNLRLVISSLTSDEFILRVPAEYDYHFKSAKRDKAIELLVPLYKHLSEVHNWQRKELKQKWRHGKLKEMVVTRLKTQTLQAFTATQADDDAKLHGFISKGADINETQDGRTCLHEAVSRNHLKVGKLLISKRAKIDVKDNDGKTCLHIASEKGFEDFAKLLLKAKARVNEIDFVGRTALHEAAVNGRANLLGTLLCNMASVNSTDTEEQTALHCVSANGVHVSVKLLLQARANINLTDRFGATARTWAKFGGHHKVLHFLDEADRILEKDWVVLSKHGVQVREYPDPTSKTVTRYRFELQIEVFERRGDWLKTRDGWLLASSDGEQVVREKTHGSHLRLNSQLDFKKRQITNFKSFKNIFDVGDIVNLRFLELQAKTHSCLARVQMYNREKEKYNLELLPGSSTTLQVPRIVVQGVPTANVEEAKESALETLKSSSCYSFDTMLHSGSSKDDSMTLSPRAGAILAQAAGARTTSHRKQRKRNIFSPKVSADSLPRVDEGDEEEDEDIPEPPPPPPEESEDEEGSGSAGVADTSPVHRYNKEYPSPTRAGDKVKEKSKASTRMLKNCQQKALSQGILGLKEEDMDAKGRRNSEPAPPPPEANLSSHQTLTYDYDKSVEMASGSPKTRKPDSGRREKNDIHRDTKKEKKENEGEMQEKKIRAHTLESPVTPIAPGLGRKREPNRRKVFSSGEVAPPMPGLLVKKVNTDEGSDDQDSIPPPPDSEEDVVPPPPLVRLGDEATSSDSVMDGEVSPPPGPPEGDSSRDSIINATDDLRKSQQTGGDGDQYYNIKLLEAKITGHTSQLSIYARMRIQFRWKHKEFKGGLRVWPTKKRTNKPRWLTSRPINKIPRDSGTLRIELLNRVGDEESTEKDELIGSVDIDLKSLEYGTVLQRELQMRNRKHEGIVAIERVPLPPRAKFIYFVRHGQSEWNAAKKDKAYMSMLKRIDHPLTVKGKNQAENMAMDVEVAKKEMQSLCKEFKKRELKQGELEKKIYYERFLDARAILCSPLTRAVQTACIGLSTHPSITDHHLKITLYSDTREKRNFGGRDTTSKWSGKEIIYRVTKKMVKIYPRYDPKHSRFERMARMIDYGDATDIWWNTEAESKAALHERLRRIVLHLRYSPEGSIIIIGHSHFFRVLIGSLISEDFRRRQPELANRLVEDKLDHCAIAATIFDFGEDEGDETRIEDFRFLCKRGKLLKEKKSKDKDGSKGSKISSIKSVSWKEWHERMLRENQYTVSNT